MVCVMNQEGRIQQCNMFIMLPERCSSSFMRGAEYFYGVWWMDTGSVVHQILAVTCHLQWST